MLTLQDLETHGVYFHFHREPFDPGKLHYAAACLATGLKRLNVPVFSSFEAPPFQFRILDATRPCIFAVTQFSVSVELLDRIANFSAPHKAILSMSDTNSALLTSPRVPSLMTHENRLREVAGRRIPWAFGLSDERLQATATHRPFAERQPVLLRNFRPSLDQPVRQALDLSLLPHLEKHFAIDSSIADDHFTRLGTHLGCLAYGGSFDENLARNPYFAAQPDQAALSRLVKFHREPVIVRWDSWRWWESLSAGCLTFHLDFEKYGFLLPVAPEPWVHYIPVDFADPRATVERLMAERPRWAEIADQGRTWARTHYSPEAVARRFITLATTELWRPPAV